MNAAISEAKARLDQALIEGRPTAPLHAELAQLERDAQAAAEREASANAAEATQYKARITARGTKVADETTNRINSMIADLAPNPFSSTLPVGATP